MRKLAWAVLGFGSACLLCAYGGWDFFGLLALGSLAFAGLAMLLRRKWKGFLPWALVGLGCALGFGWFGLFQTTLEPVRAVDGQTLESTILVSSYSQPTDYGIAADGKITLAGRDFSVRVYWNGTQETLQPGDQVTAAFRMRATLPEGTGANEYYCGAGVFLLAYPVWEGTVLPAEKVPWQFFPAWLRKQTLERIDLCFPRDTAPFARALALGDSNAMDYATDTALSTSGIRHVVAVSGLHVSILCALVALLVGKRRSWAALLGLPVLVLFAAMAGFTPSITRACIMAALLLLDAAFHREYEPLTALSVAVLGMLVFNPWTVMSVSFQLSVTSVAGILLFSPRLLAAMETWRKGKKGLAAKGIFYLTQSISVTLGAMLLSTPLTVRYFNMVSLVGPLTNLLTLPVVTLCFYGILIACLLSLAWLPLGQMLAGLTAWGIRYVLGMARGLAQFPLAAVYTQHSYGLLWLAAGYGLLLLLRLRKRKGTLALLLAMGLGLSLTLGFSWMEPLLEEIRVTALDVGQGQCVLLQSQGKTFVVDCGGDRDEEAADQAAAALLAQGIRRIDGLILTHYDRDHTGGVPYLLSRVEADTAFLPGEDTQGLTQGTPTCLVSQTMCLTYGDVRLTLFPGQPGGSDNESGICVLFQTKNYDILITGDRTIAGELELLRQTALPQLELLVVGHHGARTSTGEALLEVTRPETAVISVGAENPYGHPTQEVLDRLEAFGCRVRRTDLEGTILYRG